MGRGSLPREKDTELVAFGIRHDHPGLSTRLTDVDTGCSQPRQTFDFGRLIITAQIEVNSPGSASRRNTCQAELRSSSSASAGVFQPRVLRGLVLSASATASRSPLECRDSSVPFGKY